MMRLSGPLVALALTGGLLSSAPTSAAPPRAPQPAEVEAAVPVLEWEPCEDELGPGVECATAAVPLDYDAPDGETVDLDLARIPAADPDLREGSLFVNPGGPGGSSRYFVGSFAELVPEAVTDRFDVVGIDPRGVGPSAPMACRTDERPPPFPRAFFPLTDAQARLQIRYDRWVRRACADRPTAVVEHMSTADTARDMDLLRQAVGDEQLTYYGISYGTQLGSTYAALFPDRVRSMILDAVIDPVAWSTGTGSQAATTPFSRRLGSGFGAWQGLTAAFAECDRVGRARCPIARDAAETWRQVVSRLRRGPFRSPATGRVTYDQVVGSALGALYSQDQIPPLMRGINQLHRAMFGRGAATTARLWNPLAARRRSAEDRGIPGPYLPGAAPAYARTGNPFAGVACADTDNPASERTWIEAARQADRSAPWFGRLWTWASGVCAGWPEATREDRFTGPYETTTAAPVLVVGNTYDPATPLSGARAVNRLLDGSRLLVLDGWGHGAIGTGPCVTQAYGDYLVDGTLPRPGTVCRPATQLFPR